MITHLEPDILECKVKWAFGSNTTNKATRDDGISVDLLQILKVDAVKVLCSICQQTLKTQQCPQDQKRPFSLQSQRRGILKILNYCTIALISHAGKVMLKIFHARLQFSSVNSVALSCLTLCDPMNCSMPGFPVHHQLPELTQNHIL